jgi:hypothetical protein
VKAAVVSGLAALVISATGCAAGDGGTVTIFARSPVHSFVPAQALGAGVDGHEHGEVKRMLSPGNVRAMRSAGLLPLTYRLRTELAGEAWHWNPRGRWSDAAHRQGYWVSDAHSRSPIELSYGYRLPRRGNTHDEANDDGYSRLDDGDRATFWKSNPYLDAHFTGEENARHPQWVVIDFGRPQPVNAMRIAWGAPFATQFTVEYANHELADYFCQSPPGVWRRFPGGNIREGKGGESWHRLAPRPIAARYIRIRMSESSGVAAENGGDVRDALGYAIREIEAGTIDDAGMFRDLIVHAADHRQTVMHVSSTDPWHRERDRDRNVEQPGFDLVMRSGLTNGLPMLVPAAIAYDTPENAAAEIAFLKSRGCAVSRIELGEEPDGQSMDPRDFGALYVRFADAIRAVDRGVSLGGPSFVAVDADPRSSDSTHGSGWWLSQFLRYLRARQHAGDFRFLSFEWYPFDDLREPADAQLARAPGMLAGAWALMRRSGLAARTPVIISEYGYSAYAGSAEVEMPGALLNADIVGRFLTLGGDAAYLYGYEPNSLIDEQHGSWGNNMLFLKDRSGRIRAPIATYHAARLVTQEWAQPGGGSHAVFAAKCDIANASGESLVTAYALRRPDRRWAVMLINKDPANARRVRLRFSDTDSPMRAPLDLFQFSSQQYAWHANGAAGFPTRSDPPARTALAEIPREGILLPPYSITVVRGSPASR